MADGRTVTAGVTLVFIVVWVVLSGARVFTRSDEPPPHDRGVAPKVEALSEEQVRRITAFKARLGDLDPSSLEQTLANFSRDAHPDREIAIRERIADVVEAELRARGNPSDEQRRLIYEAVLGCSLTEPRAEVLLQANPRLQALDDLEQVAARWRSQ